MNTITTLDTDRNTFPESRVLSVQDRFTALLNVAPERAMECGVTGNDEASNALRAKAATALLQEYGRRSENAYAQATGSLLDPTPQQIFALPLVVEAAGDLRRVVASPAFEWALEVALDAVPDTFFVNDEDGERWVTVHPAPEQVAEYTARLNTIRTAFGVTECDIQPITDTPSHEPF